MNTIAQVGHKPRRRSLARARILPALLLAVIPHGASAQTSSRWPRRDFEGWTDLEVAHALKPYANLNLNGGLRWSGDADHLIYRRVAAGVNFKLSKYLTIYPAYGFYYTDSTRTALAGENRLSLTATAGAPFGRWRISDRNAIEKRYLPSGESWRYRNRVEIQRPLKVGHRSFQASVWDEVFYDSAVRAWSRNRAAVGAEREIGPRLRVGLYFVHQNDGHTRPGDYNALAMTLRTRL